MADRADPLTDEQRDRLIGSELLQQILEIEVYLEIIVAATFDVRDDRRDAFFDAFLNGASFGRKLEVLRHALQVHGIERREYDDLLRKLRQLGSARNDLVHFLVMPGDDPGMLTFVRRRGGLLRPSDAVTRDTSALREITVEVITSLARIMDNALEGWRERTGHDRYLYAGDEY